VLLVFMVTSAFARFELHAEVTKSGAATPPDFPDGMHVENGCYLSTLVYLAKFIAAFPGEQAASVMVQPRNYDEPHTIALVSWRGRWWGRDEYCGVFEVDAATHPATVTDSLTSAAEKALEKYSARLAKAGRVAIAPPTPNDLPLEKRAHEIAAARALLTCDSALFWVKTGGRELPFLFFHPAPGLIAVYDPVSGTATAESVMTNGARVVELVAAKLGYKVAAVRADLPLPSNGQFAMAGK